MDAVYYSYMHRVGVEPTKRIRGARQNFCSDPPVFPTRKSVRENTKNREDFYYKKSYTLKVIAVKCSVIGSFTKN